MTYFLSKIRRLIGKNTKFKISACQCSLQINGVFLSFILFAALFPVCSWGALTVKNVDLNNLVYKSDLVKQIVRFTGEVWSNLERPNSERKSFLPLHDGQVSQQARDLIRNHAKRYLSLASNVHFLDQVDSSGGGQLSNSEGNVTRDVGRMKRDVILAEATSNLTRRRRKTLNHEDEGTFVINEVFRATPQYYDETHVVDINYQRISNQSFVFSIEPTENGRELIMHNLDDQDLKQSLLLHTNAKDAVAVDVFTINKDLFAFTTVNHEPRAVESSDTIDTGSTLYRVNLSNKTFDITQKIHMPFAKSSTFWSGSGEGANDIFLAIAPEKTVTETGYSFNVMVACYRWQGGYFDFVSQVPASNPQSIQHFDMFSHDYLAVANYQDDAGSTNIHSEIFKYNHKEGRFMSFQKIQTFGAKDIRHFTFDSGDGKRQEHFIAIANHCKKDESGRSQFWVQSTIMKFVELRFIPFKSFYTNGAVQFLPCKHEDKFFLVMADLMGFRLLQYNGWTFVETQYQAFSSQQKSPISILMRPMNHDQRLFFSVASGAEGVKNGMYTVGFETRNDHRKLVKSVETWCEGANQQIQSKDIANLENQIMSSPKITDSKVTVHGTITFTREIRVEDLESRALGMRGRSLGGNEFKNLASNERRFRLLRSSLSAINMQLSDVVWLNRDQSISGDVQFQDVFYQSPSLEVTDLKVETLGTKRVADHLNNLIFVNESHSLKSIVTDQVSFPDLSTSTINGHSLSDYALRESSIVQAFTGRNEFLSEVYVDNAVHVQENFAGLSFTNPMFLLTNTNQTFPGATMRLNGASVKNLYTRTLNNHDVFHYFLDALPLSGGTIKAEKRFVNLVVENANLQYINNVNIDQLYSNAIYTDGRFQQNFTGATYFERLNVPGSLSPTETLINQKYDLSQDFISLQGGKYKLRNLFIAQNTNIDDLFVMSRLNDIHVTEGRLDVFLANSEEPQTIKGKTLEGIIFQQDVEAEELVDGVNLSKWSEIQQITLHTNMIEGDININGDMITNNGLQVNKDFIQGNSNVLHVLRTSAPLDSEVLPGSGTLLFDSLEVLGDSTIAGKLNDVQPSQWVFNDISEVVTITGEKTFSGSVHLEKDCRANGLYGSKAKNSENVFSVLPRLLLDGIDQTITQENMAFSGSFQANNADCPDSILNGIPFENLMLKKGDQAVQVRSVFRQPLMINGKTTVFGNVATEMINGLRIDSAVKDTLRTGKDAGVQVISEEYKFAELKANQAEVEGSFASSDVNSIFGNIILKNSNSPIVLDRAHLSFNKGATMDILEVMGRINEIHSSNWGNNWLLTTSDQTVTTQVEFAKPVTATVFQAPAVDGIDVVKLSTEILRIDQDESIAQHVEFSEEVKVPAGVIMPNKAIVNGIDLRHDVLLKSSPQVQVVSGEKTFKNGMAVIGNLEAGSILGFDLAQFRNLLNAEARNSQESLTVSGDLILTTEPEIKDSINGLNWERILDEVWFQDEDITLANPVQFSSLKLLNGGELAESATLNGIELIDLEKNYASKTRNQEWTGSVSFEEVDEISKVQAETLTLEDGGLFNGVNVRNFYTSVLCYSGDQNVHGDLNARKLAMNRLDTESEATLNSVAVPQDLLRLHAPNQITALKRFDRIIANEVVLSPDTNLNGINVGEWKDSAVLRDGSQKITGPVEFESLKMTASVAVDGLVDGVNVSPDTIFTTDLNQKIFGKVTVRRSLREGATLTASDGVSFEGSVNGINFKEKVSKLVFNDPNDQTPIRIAGETTFNAPLVLNQVRTEGLFQGQNVTAIMGRFSETHNQLSSHDFNAKELYESLVSEANQLLKKAEKRAIFLDHYVLTQTIQVAATYVKVLRQVGYPCIAMGLKESNLITTEKRYLYNAAVDYYQFQIRKEVQMEGFVVDIAELRHGKDALFAFAVNTEGNDRPAQAALEVMNSVNSFEINKSPGKLSKTFILKSVDSGTASVRPAISQVIYADSFKSLRSFEVFRNEESVSCLAATSSAVNELESSNFEIFCLDSLNGVLSSVHKTSMDSPSLLTSWTVANTTNIGVLTRSGPSQPEGLLEIWKESQRDSIQFSKLDCLTVFNPVSIDSISTEDGKTFLAVASGALRGTEYKGSVYIYRYSVLTQQFKKVQTIEVNHPTDVKFQWFQPSKELVMYVLSNEMTNNVQVYKYKGLAGWTRKHSFTSEDGRSLQVTDLKSDGVYRAQLLVTSPTQTNIYAAELMGLNPGIEEVIEMESKKILTARNN